MAGRGGLFIVLEGAEGAGKTTQAQLLSAWLAEHGVAHVLTREPGGTPAGEAIRRILLEHGSVPARTELFLLLAARAALLEQVVEPALAAGQVVVADRYELSTLAYQAYGRGLPLDEVRRLNRFATGGRRPDLTLVLDVSPDEGEVRRARAGRGADRIEGAGAEFHARVAEAYRLLAEQEPNVELLDGAAETWAVQTVLRRRLRQRYPETFPSEQG